MASAKNSDPAPAPEEKPEMKADPGHGEDQADAVELAADRDPLDATRETFTEDDADERGWLVHREPPVDGVQKYHRVPVARWAAYESRYRL